MLQNFRKIVCRRRAPTTHALASQLGDITIEGSKLLSPGMSDDACKSTDTSGPEQIADSFDGSDTDDSDVLPNSEASSEFSDREHGFMDWSSAAASDNFSFWPEQTSQSIHAKPQAAVCAPSQNSTQHLRDSIRSVIDALDAWERSTAAEDLYRQHPDHPNGEVQSHTLAVLEQAFSKLTPQDAAMVRTFVDAKMINGTPQAEPSHCYFQSVEPHPQSPALLSRIASFGSSNCKQTAAMKCTQPAALLCSGVKQNQRARPWDMELSTATRRDCGSKQGAKFVEQSFRANLRKSRQFDPAQVLMLQRVDYLGINPQALLEAYFAQFGIVERVMVCRTRSKSVPGARMRMAGLGFLVMRQTKDVDRILAYGPEHVLRGIIVTVGRYETRELDDMAGPVKPGKH